MALAWRWLVFWWGVDRLGEAAVPRRSRRRMCGAVAERIGSRSVWLMRCGFASTHPTVGDSADYGLRITDYGLRFTVYGSRATGHGPRATDQGPGTRDQGPGTRDQGPGTRDQGPGTRDQGLGTRDQGPPMHRCTDAPKRSVAAPKHQSTKTPISATPAARYGAVSKRSVKMTSSAGPESKLAVMVVSAVTLM